MVHSSYLNWYQPISMTVWKSFRGHCTFYPLTQSVELLHGAAVTLLALGLCILLQGCHRERLLQSQHDLIDLQEQNTALPSIIIRTFNNQSVHLSANQCYLLKVHHVIEQLLQDVISSAVQTATVSFPQVVQFTLAAVKALRLMRFSRPGDSLFQELQEVSIW